MRTVRAASLTFVLALAGAGLAQAQQPYPPQFTSQWQNSCLNSCQSNALYKGREALCPSYCNCIVQEAQASIPLEIAMQADKDMAAKNTRGDAVQRVNQVTHQCQSRVLPPQQPGKTTTKTR